jgi:hypothetical protein
MSDKVKDLELDEFISMVLESDETVANQVKEANINAAAIVGKHKKNIDKYGVSTGTAFALARLKEAILEANSESIKGLLVGQRDRFGTNAPVRMPIISSSGEHTEVVNWGTTVKMGDSKVEISYPSVASLRILHDGEYKGVPNIRLISAEKIDSISVPDAILRLGKVAKEAGEVDGGDELKVVVVRGKIAYVAPATRWKGKEKDGSWQIYMQNQRDNPVMHPVMQISLEVENQNMVRAIFERQHNAIPTIMVEDFIPLVEDAVKDNTDPVEQARFFGEIMRGREVIIVGFVTKFSPQPEINYIDMNAYAIFDAKVGKQTAISKKEEAKDEPEDEPAEEPKKAAKEPAKAASKKSAGKAGALTFDTLKNKVREYCETLDYKPSDLTPEKVQKEFAQGKSIGFVKEVLDELIAES